MTTCASLSREHCEKCRAVTLHDAGFCIHCRRYAYSHGEDWYERGRKRVIEDRARHRPNHGRERMRIESRHRSAADNGEG